MLLPKSLDQRAASPADATSDGRWFFFREGDVYLGVCALTRPGSRAVDRYRYSIKAQGVKHGDHWQTGFVFEVGTKRDNGVFAEFQEKLRNNPITVTWGDADHAAPELEYSDSQRDVLPTDSSWECHVDGPWRITSTYDKVLYDARREIPESATLHRMLK